eukprot:12721155-Alexandrium_andersonii.AAC.1
MSASLVGSEMCIRDSLSARAVLAGKDFKARVRPVLLEHIRSTPGLGAYPVSYTHLTLPTICSV